MNCTFMQLNLTAIADNGLLIQWHEPTPATNTSGYMWAKVNSWNNEFDEQLVWEMSDKISQKLDW